MVSALFHVLKVDTGIILIAELRVIGGLHLACAQLNPIDILERMSMRRETRCKPMARKYQ